MTEGKSHDGKTGLTQTCQQRDLLPGQPRRDKCIDTSAPAAAQSIQESPRNEMTAARFHLRAMRAFQCSVLLWTMIILAGTSAHAVKPEADPVSKRELTLEQAQGAIEAMLDLITVDRDLYAGVIKDAKGLKNAKLKDGGYESGIWYVDLNHKKFAFHLPPARPIFFYGEITYAPISRKWIARIHQTQCAR